MGQHVGEVDLVDAAEEVDDHRAGGGQLEHALAGDEERHQEAQAGAGVGLKQEMDGAPRLLGCRYAQGREHAMVEGVVQEQDLGGLDDDRRQGQQASLDQVIHDDSRARADATNHRTDRDVGDQAEDDDEDACGEVVDEHFEADRNLVFQDFVDLLHAVAADGAHDHAAQEHRDVGTDDDAHGRSRADHAAAHAMDHLAARVADEQGQEVDDHGADELAEVRVRHPAGGDEQGGDQTPSDERPNIGDHHAGQEAAELLDLFSHRSSLLMRMWKLRWR